MEGREREREMMNERWRGRERKEESDRETYISSDLVNSKWIRFWQ